MSTKPILAAGLTFVELTTSAKAAIAAGDNNWPKVVLSLLRKICDLERKKQELSQGELFGVGQTKKKPEERNGV